MDLEEMFEKHADEYIKFERVENPLSKRPDLHAFMVLDKMMPGEGALIAASEHDEYYLSINVEEFAKVVTEAQLIDLIRCGIRYDSGTDSLCLFV